MEIGQVVDYVFEYNELHGYDEGPETKEKEKPNIRKATQADWDAFWG